MVHNDFHVMPSKDIGLQCLGRLQADSKVFLLPQQEKNSRVEERAVLHRHLHTHPLTDQPNNTLPDDAVAERTSRGDERVCHNSNTPSDHG